MADLPEGYRIRQPALPEGYSIRGAPAEPKKYLGSDVADAVGDLTKGPEMPVSTMISQAIENAPESAVQFGKDIIQPIIHPVDTAESIGKIILGTIQKGANAVVSPETQLAMGGSFGSEYEPYAEAVGKFFADRYGGAENLKKTMARDPVGFAADVSAVLTLGGSAAARAPGQLGKIGKAASGAGQTVNPLAVVGKTAKPVLKAGGKLAADVIGGLGTHTGGESLRAAAKAGHKGGEAARAFREQMRGTAPMGDVVDDAKRAVTQMRVGRGQDYRTEMAKIGQDTKVLDFDAIDKAVTKAAQVQSYKGVSLDPKSAAISKEIMDTVDEWKNLDPAEFHTAEGLDALKKKIGIIRDRTQYGTPDRVIANQAYNAVKERIVKQAPEYAKVMKDYEEASDLIREMEQTLSLNPKARIDTSLRKLQSVLRNNANTNYGRRVELADLLVDAGARHLMEKLAGQSLNTLAPRGLGKLVAGGTAAGGYIDPTLLMALPLQSPRIMGEAAYLAGRGGRVVSPAIEALPGTGLSLYQTGRLSEPTSRLLLGASPGGVGLLNRVP